MKRRRSVERIIMSRFAGYSIAIWAALLLLQAFFSLAPWHVFGTDMTFAELAFTAPDERTWTQTQYTIEIIAATLVWLIGVAAVYFCGIKLFGQGIIRKIAKPIRRMQEGFREITGGNYDIALDFDTETEFKEMRDAFNLMARKLKDSEEKRKEMESERMQLFSHIAHDLKTPITTIAGYSGALTNGIVEGAEKQREYHQAIKAKSEQMTRLIEQLLTYSKLGMSEYKLNFEQIDLAEIVRAACALLFGEIEGKQMGLALLLPDEALHVSGDPLELSRAISNLLTNAIHHNPKGTLLLVELSIEPAQYTLKIADSGPAIPDSISGSLFEPFISGSASRSSGSGTGLGLAIVKKVAQQHGGDVFLSNAPAPYTKMFVIYLPKT